MMMVLSKKKTLLSQIDIVDKRGKEALRRVSKHKRKRRKRGTAEQRKGIDSVAPKP